VRYWAALVGSGLGGWHAAGCCTPLLYSPVFRCSLVAVAAAGLLLPEGFSRCCRSRATDPAATRADPAAILGLRPSKAKLGQPCLTIERKLAAGHLSRQS
jgi:hypothetical protein